MAQYDQDGERPEADESERWARESLARLAAASLAEQRRTRRWGILFKSLILLYLFVVLFAVLRVGPLAPGDEDTTAHTAVVDVNGLIAPGTDASADRLIRGLEAAFADSQTRGVILRINSPGGSPVQAGMVYDAIGRLREQNPDVPVYAVATDLCASGGYYIAAAADRVFANRASVVGSIGVRIGGFGFVEAMEDLGVERRMITAGENKALLDPFLPQGEEEVAHMEDMVGRIHDQFVQAVKDGRGDRLAANTEVDLFSGLIWTGDRAVELGLVDELASPARVAREVVGAKRMVNFTPRKDFLQRISDRVGVAFAQTIKSELLGPEFH
jgi:protease-4